MAKRTSGAKKSSGSGKAKEKVKGKDEVKGKMKKPRTVKPVSKTTKRAATTVAKPKKMTTPKSRASVRTKAKAQPKKAAVAAAKKPRKPALPRGLVRAVPRALAPRVTLWPVHVVTIAKLDSGDPADNPGSAEFAYRLLAEGDSWFTIAGVPSSNMLYELELPQQGIVVNIAYPGDTLVHIADLASNDDLKKMLTDRFGYRWHAILLSAGGNDLMDRAGEVLTNPGNGSADPGDYVDPTQLAAFVADVQLGYRTIVGLRDSSQSANNGVPVIVHCYDYPTPRDAGALFLGLRALGPWLYKAFNDKLIDASLWNPVSDLLVNALADGIGALASGPSALPDFHLVDTRGTLDRAAPGTTGVSGDWLNEIHPTRTGYRKLANKIGAMILGVLPG